MECLLCKNKDTNTISSIRVDDLNKLYLKTLNIDVSSEFRDNVIHFQHCPLCDLRFFYPLSPGSDEFYQQLQNFDWYYLSEKQEYEIAKKFVKSNDQVLDVGAGSGAFQKLIPHAQFTGLELNTKAIADGQKNGIVMLNETVQEHSQKKAGYYDVVTAFQVLEHIPQINDFVDSCIKCLKPNGLLIFSVPGNDGFVADVYNMGMNMPPHHISRWSDEALKNIGKVFDLNPIHLEHDSLATHHHFMYSTTEYEKFFYSDLSMSRRKKLIDNSLSGFLINKLAKLLSYIHKKGVSKHQVFGHSVTIVLKKP
ncbi:MAG: methyltransferase domain-containing protein [Cytophagaceae bacterium]